MKTVHLYHEDAYLLDFEAEVVARTEHEGLPAVVLDRTAFYPESGGQPWDKGTLGGADVVKVLDIEGTILHVLEHEIGAGPARGRVHWATRFDHMQQHTGQHILSQAFWELLEGETLSFHMGPDVSTLEIGLRTISDFERDKVEDRANGIVWENREVKTYFVPEERIGEVPLRRPPKKQGLLRVVEVDGFDYSACGGTHCRRTGEAGPIKLAGVERIRGNLRFEFLCGARALRDHRAKDRAVRKLAATFSCPDGDVVAQVERLAADGKSLKKRSRRLEERLAGFEAQEVVRGAAGPIIGRLFEERSPEEARMLALNVIKSGPFAVVFGVAAGSQGRLIVARSDSLNVDLRQLVPVIGAVIPVKGGGSPSLVELVAEETARLHEAVDAAVDWLKEDR